MCKPVIAVMDPESASGAMSVNEVHAALYQANAMFDTWGFAGDGGPNGPECVETIFSNEPIEWNRIGAFQDVTLRLIAERLLPRDHQGIHLTGELTNSKISVPDSRARGYEYHLYVSSNNEGALEFIREVDRWLAARVAAQEEEKMKRRQKRKTRKSAGTTICPRTQVRRSEKAPIAPSVVLALASRHFAVLYASEKSAGTGRGVERASRKDSLPDAMAEESMTMSSEAVSMQKGSVAKRSSSGDVSRNSILARFTNFSRSGASSGASDVGACIRITQDLGELDRCEAMLCFLNNKTWTNGAPLPEKNPRSARVGLRCRFCAIL